MGKSNDERIFTTFYCLYTSCLVTKSGKEFFCFSELVNSTGAVALCYVKSVVDTLSKLRVTLVISFKVREMCRSRSQCFDCSAEVE